MWGEWHSRLSCSTQRNPNWRETKDYWEIGCGSACPPTAWSVGRQDGGWGAWWVLPIFQSWVWPLASLITVLHSSALPSSFHISLLSPFLPSSCQIQSFIEQKNTWTTCILLPGISNSEHWKETKSLEAGQGTNKHGDPDATALLGATWHNLPIGTESPLLTHLFTWYTWSWIHSQHCHLNPWAYGGGGGGEWLM